VPKLSFSVPHSKGKDEVRSRLEAFADRVRAKYEGQVKDVKQSWDGDTLSFGFRTLGNNIEGRLTVEDDRLAVDGSLPFAAMMFKGKIESTIREELERLLA
jgi:putative polyhydroxyalkanoate system protein